MSYCSAHTETMARPKIKNERIEFRPSPVATLIVDHFIQINGATKTGVMEAALREYARAHNVDLESLEKRAKRTPTPAPTNDTDKTGDNGA